jgi:hypothetical protein
LVDADKWRQVGYTFPKAATQGRDLLRFATIISEKNETAETVLLKQQPLVLAERRAAAADDEHLTDFSSQILH